MKSKWINVFFSILLVVGIFSIYQNTVNNGFSGLDDILMIEENWDRLQHLDHVKTAFTEDVFIRAEGSYYRPLQLISYMADVYLSNSNTPVAKIFFQINILLFIIAFLLLFYFLAEFDFSRNFRFIFTSLMAVHPALTPAVSWIPGRVDTLLFIIMIGSLWSFVKYLKTKKNKWVVVHLALFTAGIFTKETAISIPLLGLLFLWLFTPESQKNPTPWRWAKLINIKIWTGIFKTSILWIKQNLSVFIAWGFIVAFWLILRNNALDKNSLGIMGILYQLNTSWKEFIILASITYFPIDLQVFLDITTPYILMAIPGCLFFLAVPHFLNSNYKYSFFGLIWMFILILPTTLSDSLNYHRMFIPFVGMAFILQPLSRGIIKNQILIPFSILFLGLFVYQNLKFQKAYINKNTFWKNAVKHSPNSPFSNNGIAWSYHIDHENDSALKYYQRVIDLKPSCENVRIGMALISEEIGASKNCDSLLQEEFKATHDSSIVYFFIGQIQLDRGDTFHAIPNLIKGYQSIETSRNSRLYYDTLSIDIKSQLNIN